MNYRLFSFFMLMAVGSHAQQPRVPRDTSFTVNATFEKEKTTRPYIQIAAVTMPEGARVKKDVVYRTIGKRELLIDIYAPKSLKKKYPAVLLIFGGGWRSGDKSHNEVMATALVQNGYVAMSPQYRLSTEAQYPAAVYDLKEAVRWMKLNAKQWNIDTNRIAVLGCSAGGQLAALLGTTNNDPIFEEPGHSKKASANVQAAVNIDGILAFHHPESGEGNSAAKWLGGTYAEKPAKWTEASPLEHVNAGTVPIIFINSSIPRFHSGRTDMIRKLDSLHIYSEVHTLDDTPHPFWFFDPWFKPMMGYIVAFLDKHLKS